MDIKEEFIVIVEKVISDKDVLKLAKILKIIEEIAEENLFHPTGMSYPFEGPLSPYYLVEKEIGETEAFSELSSYWEARGTTIHQTFQTLHPIRTMQSFESYWGVGTKHDGLEWNAYFDIKVYMGHAEFMLNHLNFYKDFSQKSIDLIHEYAGRGTPFITEKKIKKAVNMFKEQLNISSEPFYMCS